MSTLEARGAAIGALAKARLAVRVRDSLDALPGISATVEDGRVVLTGRGLARRAIDDAALRWVAGGLR